MLQKLHNGQSKHQTLFLGKGVVGSTTLDQLWIMIINLLVEFVEFDHISICSNALISKITSSFM